MAVAHRCNAIRQEVAAGLQQTVEPHARRELVFAALYELSRTVLPELGVPKKTQEYLDRQEAVLDLITFLVIPLIRTPTKDQSAVTVLSELAEGCLDSLLRKKLSVYAQQLRAKAEGADAGPVWSVHFRQSLALCCVAAALIVSLVLPEGIPGEAPDAGAPNAGQPPKQTATATVRGPDGVTGRQEQAAENGPVKAPVDAEARKAEPAGDEPAQANVPREAPRGEQVTRVRIVDNQVLVPVVLRENGVAAKVELVLDTGATRTTLHDGIAARLPIDLNKARNSQAWVADGRAVRSRVVVIDNLAVGPFAVAGMEIELIPYHGGDSLHDGLLGMDFLARHRYQIDMEHELIRWF